LKSTKNIIYLNLNGITMTKMNLRKASAAIIIFVAITTISAAPLLISTNASAQQRNAALGGGDGPWFCGNKLLKDAPAANDLGWNPDGAETVFTISDPCFLQVDSIVLLNVKDGGPNFEVCNVDYMYDGAFEVFCNSPPAEGSELHYNILYDDKTVIEDTVKSFEEIKKRTSNSTQ
jgi:hypothetical protein